MKKLLIALMAISLIFGLASCKSTNQEDASETPVEQPQEPTDETVDDRTYKYGMRSTLCADNLIIRHPVITII